MRCKACDSLMTLVEETSRKYKSNGAFVDLCNTCFATISDDIETITKYSAEDEADGEE